MKKGLIVSALLLAAVVLVSCKSKGESTEAGKTERAQPNIIYILADDLGYGELGAYGQEKIETPHIDALAQQGMRFTQHYAGAPVCAPSRCVLLTGKHTGHTYIRGNDEWKERGEVWDYAKAVEDPGLEGQRPIPAGTVTLGEVLQEAGYKTACVGKWGLGAPNTEGIPTKQGFDFFFGYNCQRQAHNLYPKHLWRNEEKVWLDNELVVPKTKLEEGADPYDAESYDKFVQKQYAPELMLEEALSFMEQSREEPFFLYFASPLPHVPLQVPPSYIEKYRKKFGEEEPYLGDNGYFPHRSPRAAYAAMVSYLDEQVGKIVEKLKALGVYENTLIIFSSDNGPTYGGGADSPFFDSAAPFSSEHGRGKGFTYEGGIRVPMIASWPGKITKGTTSDHVSAFWDVVPTLAKVAGAEPPEGIDGVNFLPALLGEEKQPEHEFLYWEFPAYGGQQSVRLGKWKGIRKDIFKGNMEVELYDLEKDNREEHNVAAKYPEVVRQIEEIMAREHETAVVERFRFSQLGDI